MDQSQFIEQARQKMYKALEIIKTDVATVRTGRATPSLVDHLTISAYDGTTIMKISELATITASDARTLVITPFDPTQLAVIEKGLLQANVGLTPVVDGSIIRMSVPLLTQERRAEYIRLAKAKIEGGRVMVRQVRHDLFAQTKRAYENDELNEDAKIYVEKQIQEITDKIMTEIEAVWQRKEEELRQI